MVADDAQGDGEFWTEAGAAQLLAAAEALAEAVRRHARVAADSRPSQDIRSVFAANEALLPVVLAYADAHLELTGNGSPFGPLHDSDETDDLDEDDAEAYDDAEPSGGGLSVLSRQDLVLIDEDAVLTAGRLAYQELWPEDPPSAAVEDVTHVGRALYQYAHLNGWDKVREMPGLVPVGAVTVVHAHEDLLRGDPDDWPDDAFLVDAPVIHTQSEVYG